MRSRHHMSLVSGIGRLPDSPPTVSSSSSSSSLISNTSTLPINRARASAANTSSSSSSALNDSERQTHPVRLNVSSAHIDAYPSSSSSSSSSSTATLLHNNDHHHHSSMIPFRTPPAQRFFLSSEGDTAGRTVHQPATPISFLSPNGAADAIMAHSFKIGHAETADSSTPEMNNMSTTL